MKKNNTLVTITQTAIMAALCYVGFEFFQIPIPLPSGTTAFHLGNVFCVLAALLLGGPYGGMAGAIGMTLADLLDPRYITSAPKTFVLKLGIGLICGLVAHRIGGITRAEEDGTPKPKKKIALWCVLGCSAGLLFNIIFEPVVSYLYQRFLLGQAADAAMILAKWQAVTTLVNAVIAVIVATLLYMALHPALDKAGVLRRNIRF